jgi:predicted CopG family antitoxin
MHRSQIMLKEEHYAYLVSEAQRQDKSISQIVRELIDEHISRSRNLEDDPFFEIIGMVEGDGEPVGRSIDYYVYGIDRPEDRE